MTQPPRFPPPGRGPYGPPPGYGPLPGYGPPPGYPPPGPRQPYGAPLPPPGAYPRGPHGIPPLPPPGYYARPYPPPRSGGGGAGVVFAIALVFVLIGGLVAFATTGGRNHASSSYATSTPSFTYTTPTWPTTTAYATTTRSYARTTSAAPTTPAGPQPVAATSNNPLFRGDNGLDNHACDYPGWAPNVVAAQQFFQAGVACLDRMWRDLLAVQNLPFSSPGLSVTDGAPAASPCGGSPTNPVAFYCSANKTIYMPLQSIFTNEDPGDPIIFLTILAHEYGHHVQALTGIMAKQNQDARAVGSSSAAGLEMSRRLELEAQCFGGMFIGSSTAAGTVSAEQAGRALDDNYHRGDQPGDMRDHGTEAHNGGWLESGYHSNRAPKCNTWLASSADVS
ncbi:neutral zinc metallopeptidase [Nocardia spumae]|uniref:neutral zinc metallopeptidase n=1 Tax=Nocardia spumae TaxID=2887190 RepID=UPI00272DD19C|nr:neutral zinc metallopeptidase [Nocardia spumae]